MQTNRSDVQGRQLLLRTQPDELGLVSIELEPVIEPIQLPIASIQLSIRCRASRASATVQSTYNCKSSA